MSLKIRRIGADGLSLYARIPQSFTVKHVLRMDPVEGGLGGLRLYEEKVKPYVKWDEPQEQNSPLTWPRLYNFDEWGVFMAYRDHKPVGGVALGSDAPGGLSSAFEAEDSVVLWDIRVHPTERKRGVASALFLRGVEWAREKGFRRLKLEVTSANLPMCRFCVKMGCELAATHKYGYETAPNASGEAMLIWYYDL